MVFPLQGNEITAVEVQIPTDFNPPFIKFKLTMAMVFSKFLTAYDIENGLSILGCSLGQLPD
ncbi:hypothetical protein SADUNF_Sadunf01G0177500 [Salix dunnii]|uniref:Uncharacterized protein n=1 Tax=Salix dunnii TaxID=1413687 RepID=A0A835NCG9_9ROSI|nr:hypothetical protein SADUNF_Sadunf01G0177500 [Salix dunnii]